MMDFGDVQKFFKTEVKDNGPLLLSIAAGVGILSTVYLAAKAGFKSAKMLDEYDENEGVSDDKVERVKDHAKVVWKLYIPTAISAAGTIACIVAANRLETRKTLAAQSAFALTQQLYDEYRERVIENYGASKDQAIHDQIAEDRVKRNPPPDGSTLVIEGTDVLCFEVYTGRYFRSDMETLRRAMNTINAKLLREDYATLDDWYYEVKLGQTQVSSRMGWTSSKQMELTFTSVLTDDGRPCLAFEYNYVKLL